MRLDSVSRTDADNYATDTAQQESTATSLRFPLGRMQTKPDWKWNQTCLALRCLPRPHCFRAYASHAPRTLGFASLTSGGLDMYTAVLVLALATSTDSIE